MFPIEDLHLRALAGRALIVLALPLALACGGGGGGSETPGSSDTIAPTVLITDSVSAATATGPVTFTFTFNESVDNTFTISKVAVTGGTKASFTRTSSTVSTLLVIPNTGTGTITVSLAAGAFKDFAGNANTLSYQATQAYDYTPVVTPKSAKRGVCIDTKFLTPAQTTSDLTTLAPGVSWWYNWNPNSTLSAAIDTSNNMEFIPMYWGGTFDAAGIGAQIDAHPGVEYLLVVNEPNFTDQANMTPSACAAVWPQIEALATAKGVKIVGPAMGWSGDATWGDPVVWLDAFYTAYRNAHGGQDPRIDAIAAHWYDYGFDWFLDKFAKYGKPLWVTEFANWHDEPGWKIDTAAKQKDTMKEMVDACEYRSDVQRYAWFMGRMSPDPHYSSLLSTTGAITEVGQYYLDLPYNTGSTVTLPSTSAAAPTDPAGNVIALVSGKGTYTPITVSTWRTDWSAAGTSCTDITLGGSSFRKLKFTTGLFLGVEGFAADITGKTTLHLDYWTPEGTSLKIKIVDFGADGAYNGTGANADTDTSVTFNAAGTGGWHSVELDFSAQVNKAHIRQLVFEVPAAVTTWYIDNLYFK